MGKGKNYTCLRGFVCLSGEQGTRPHKLLLHNGATSMKGERREAPKAGNAGLHLSDGLCNSIPHPESHRISSVLSWYSYVEKAGGCCSLIKFSDVLGYFQRVMCKKGSRIIGKWNIALWHTAGSLTWMVCAFKWMVCIFKRPL